MSPRLSRLLLHAAARRSTHHRLLQPAVARSATPLKKFAFEEIRFRLSIGAPPIAGEGVEGRNNGTELQYQPNFHGLFGRCENLKWPLELPIAGEDVNSPILSPRGIAELKYYLTFPRRIRSVQHAKMPYEPQIEQAQPRIMM
ncbi:unnamed protein product [Citrullus colocynthis]|uniref:Uncharacterized protein n=1 Tax=Citrullus colocynthis TaxID=252529 RepID=A0ABP0XU22_9ROSI